MQNILVFSEREDIVESVGNKIYIIKSMYEVCYTS